MSGTLTPQNAGYYEGVTDVWYALMTAMDSRTGAPAYGTPQVAGKSIELSLTPNYREGKTYASDVSTRRENRVDSYTVSLNLDQIIPSVRKVLLGRRETGDGVQLVTGKAVAPWVAVMFAATLDDGSRELWVLYKGRFSEPSAAHHTKTDGDSYQHPTIQATFVRLANNDQLAAVMNPDESAPNRNLLLGTSAGAVDTPISDLTGYGDYGLIYQVTDYGRAKLLNANGRLQYGLRLVYTGQGSAPAVEGVITPVLVYEDGTSRNLDAISYQGERDYGRVDSLGDWSETTKRIAAVAFRARNFATPEDWALRLTGLHLNAGTAGWNYTLAPEDWFARVVQFE